MSDAEFFQSEAVRHARTLPLAEARRFLSGMISIAEQGSLDKARIAFTNLCIADDQLELIAHPQRLLDLNGKDGAA